MNVLYITYTLQLPIESQTVVLKLNVPILSASIPPGWTVSIVDNPGFGEAKEHVTQLADASMVTSSAYIYLMTTGDVGGEKAAEFFKELQQIDKGVSLSTCIIICLLCMETE